MGVGVATLERERFHVPQPPVEEEPRPAREDSPAPDLAAASATLRLLGEVIAVRVPLGRMRSGSDRAGFAAVAAMLDELGAESAPVSAVRVVRMCPGIAPGSVDAVLTVTMGEKVRAVDVELRADGRCCRLVGCVLL